MTPDLEDIVTTAEAAGILGVSTAYVRVLVQRGKLRALGRTPDGWRLDALDVAEYEHSHRDTLGKRRRG